MVAREGTVARACEKLLLSQPTISEQLRALEQSLQTKLFQRVGRNLLLTEEGRVVFRYADQIFSLGRDMREALKGRPAGYDLRLEIGVADVLPNLIVSDLLKPALRLPQLVQLVCHDDKTDKLLSRLALNELDVVLSDIPASPLIKVRAYNHMLGECSVSFFAAATLAAHYRSGFPKSLDQAPFLLPMEGTALRRSLDDWFEHLGIRPVCRCEIGDCDLFEGFGGMGAGIIVAPSVMERTIRHRWGLKLVGRADTIREKFFLISTERKLKHPAVVAIAEAARRRLSGSLGRSE